MSLPKFDPWLALSATPTRAYGAYCAYPELILGTLGTLGTSLQTPNGRINRGALAGWRVKLLRAQVSTATDLLETDRRVTIEHALQFCDSLWITKLVALGWGERALFTYDRSAKRHGGLIQALIANQIAAATKNAAYLCTAAGLLIHPRESKSSRVLPLIWDHP